MNDPTEATRREMVAAINSDPSSREGLTHLHGQVSRSPEHFCKAPEAP